MQWGSENGVKSEMVCVNQVCQDVYGNGSIGICSIVDRMRVSFEGALLSRVFGHKTKL